MVILKKIGLLFGLVAGFLMFSVGAFLGYAETYPLFQETLQSSKWQQVQGTILSSAITEVVVHSDQTLYSVKTSYRYDIEGQSYESTRFFTHGEGVTMESKQAAEQFAGRYPSEGPVNIFVNPVEPSKAVIVPGFTNLHYQVFGVDLFKIVAGLVIFLLCIRGLLAKSDDSDLKKPKKDQRTQKSESTKQKSDVQKRSVVMSFLTKLRSKQNPVSESAIASEEAEKNSVRSELPRKQSTVSSQKAESHSGARFANESPEAVERTRVDFALNLPTPRKNPESFEWMIKGHDKDFGPYAFEQIQEYFEKGKLRPGRQIYTTQSKELIVVGELFEELKQAA